MRRIAWFLDSPGWVWLGALALAVAVRLVGPLGEPIDIAALVAIWFFLLVLALVSVRFLVRSARARRWGRSVLALLSLFVIGSVLSHLAFPSDAYRIESAAEAAMTSTNPSYCSQDVTDEYVEQVYAAPTPFADDLCEDYADRDRADSVDVRDIDVEGDAAYATVSVHGGRQDGFDLQVELLKEDGNWKVNRIVGLGGFDRTTFERDYRRKFAEFGASSRAADCAIARTRRQPLAALEQASISGDPRPSREIEVACDRAGVERNLIAGYTDPRYGDLPAVLTDCVASKIHSASDGVLVRLSDDLVSYGALGFECDRAAMLASLEGQLEDYEGLGAEGARCVTDAISDWPATRIVRLTYDDKRYDRLVDGCKA